MPGPNQLILHRTLTAEEFRRLALQRVLDILRTFLLRIDSQAGYQARRPTTLIRHQTLNELQNAIEKGLAEICSRAGVSKIFTDYRDRDGPRVAFEGIGKRLYGPLHFLTQAQQPAASALRLLDAFNEVLAVEAQYCGTVEAREARAARTTADEAHVYFFVTDKALGKIGSWKEGVEDTRFLASVGELLRRVRRAGRKPSLAETAIVQAAYDVLARGAAVATLYRPLGVPGFREVQTLLFLTDPGEGHLRVTCRDRAVLGNPGAAVHIEHIDRAEGGDKEKVEAYRLPAPLNAAKVRLHVGSDAPCTAYIGRPVFENRPAREDPQQLEEQYLLDELKSSHMTASCCTAMFQNGIAECKIGIERMTALRAIDFMRAVAGNVFRDRNRQYLSAAFNVFTRLYDDRGPQKGWIEKPEAICKLGIELATEGGFNKVTWDGARSGEFPSQPILARGIDPVLKHDFWVDLVHQAHTRGLVTYVSAGLEPQHMPRAVFAGLDGLGIGVKLHDYDPKTLRMGELLPEKMAAVLDSAGRAHRTVLGRASKILARLGRMLFEGILTDDDDKARKRLLDVLQHYTPPIVAVEASDEEKNKVIEKTIADGDSSPAATAASQILDELRHVDERHLDDDRPLDNPLIGRWKRLQWHGERTAGHEGLKHRAAAIQAELSLRDIRKLVRSSRRAPS